GAHPRPDRLPVLRVVDGLRALGRAAAPRAAQLPQDRAARVQVDGLPDQRRAAAVGAVPAAGLPGTDALAQELAFEVGLGDAEERAEHADGFAGAHGRPLRRKDSCDRSPWRAWTACAVRPTAGRWRVDVPPM